MIRYIVSVLFMISLVACGNQASMNHDGMHAEGEAGHGDMGNAPMSMPTTNIAATPVARSNGIAIRDPWARMAMNGDNSATYLHITNEQGEDTLVQASSAIAKSVELHTVINDEDGMMKMRPVEGGIPVPAQGNQTLKPGSYHIMLIGLTRDLKKGDTFEVQLTFTNAGTIPVTVEVR